MNMRDPDEVQREREEQERREREREREREEEIRRRDSPFSPEAPEADLPGNPNVPWEDG
jgi:hypothetical protein